MFKLIVVKVHADGNFKYIDESGNPAERVTVSVGDFLSWSVALAGRPTDFQITFKSLSPFKKLREIRSNGGLSHPAQVTTNHLGRSMSYTVTLPNGWSNDPEARVEGGGGNLIGGAASDVDIDFDPDKDGKIHLPNYSPVGRGGFVRWESESGDPFTIAFPNHDSPLVNGQDSEDSGSNGVLGRQVRVATSITDYVYSITMKGQIPGYGESKLRVHV